MRLRALLLAVVVLCSGHAPSEASGPLVLVSARGSGALSLVKVYGYRAVVTELVTPPTDGRHLIPVQGGVRSVTYTAQDGDNGDVGIADVDTATLRPVSRDNRSAELLVSPDGRFRYIATLRNGYRDAIVRTDAAGRRRTTLFTLRQADDADGMSQPALSPDGRTLYVGTSYSKGLTQATYALWAVDTATGAAKPVFVNGVADGYVVNVVASPDGTTLAFTVGRFPYAYTVGLVPVTGGTVTFVRSPEQIDVVASAFTPDSRHVVVAHGDLGALTEGLVTDGLALADRLTGVAVPITGTKFLFSAVPVTDEVFPPL